MSSQMNSSIYQLLFLISKIHKEIPNRPGDLFPWHFSLLSGSTALSPSSPRFSKAEACAEIELLVVVHKEMKRWWGNCQAYFLEWQLALRGCQLNAPGALVGAASTGRSSSLGGWVGSSSKTSVGKSLGVGLCRQPYRDSCWYYVRICVNKYSMPSFSSCHDRPFGLLVWHGLQISETWGWIALAFAAQRFWVWTGLCFQDSDCPGLRHFNDQDTRNLVHEVGVLGFAG